MEPARRISNGTHQSHHTKTQRMRICYACTHNAHAFFFTTRMSPVQFSGSSARTRANDSRSPQVLVAVDEVAQ